MRSAQQDETTGHLAIVGLGHNRMDMIWLCSWGNCARAWHHLLLLACFWGHAIRSSLPGAASNIIRS